ncbi:MAG: Crp/Fnr family transcriptional regulator [Gammaproteobacteria bacterium]
MVKRLNDNRLLAALPAETYRDLFIQLEPVSLKVSDILDRPEEKTRYVYFPRNGVVSLLSTGDGMDSFEVAMVGNEGLLGVPVYLGVATPCITAMVRSPGSAMRMEARAFYRYSQRNEPLRKLLGRYTHALLTEISQLSACHHFHTIDMRLARWLLTTQDRLQSNCFTNTQLLIAQRLGVRRSGVSIAAYVLQQRNLIRYTRGNITIVNRRGLKAACCPCYNMIAAQTLWPPVEDADF